MGELFWQGIERAQLGSQSSPGERNLNLKQCLNVVRFFSTLYCKDFQHCIVKIFRCTEKLTELYREYLGIHCLHSINSIYYTCFITSIFLDSLQNKLHRFERHFPKYVSTGSERCRRKRR